MIFLFHAGACVLAIQLLLCCSQDSLPKGVLLQQCVHSVLRPSSFGVARWIGRIMTVAYGSWPCCCSQLAPASEHEVREATRAFLHTLRQAR